MGHRIMDDQRCRRYFLEPQSTFHRRYVALQAFFVEGRPLAEIAEQYGYKLASLNVMVSQFRAQCSRGRIPSFRCRRPRTTARPTALPGQARP